MNLTPCKMQASNPPLCMRVLARSWGADGCRLAELGWVAREGEAWVHSFRMLTFVFVLTGIGIVLACITGTFVANVLLIMVPPCTEHMPLHQDTWTYHVCTICDNLEGGRDVYTSPSNKEASSLAACKCSMCAHLAMGVQPMRGQATSSQQRVVPAPHRVMLRGWGRVLRESAFPAAVPYASVSSSDFPSDRLCCRLITT